MDKSTSRALAPFEFNDSSKAESVFSRKFGEAPLLAITKKLSARNTEPIRVGHLARLIEGRAIINIDTAQKNMQSLIFITRLEGKIANTSKGKIPEFACKRQAKMEILGAVAYNGKLVKP